MGSFAKDRRSTVGQSEHMSGAENARKQPQQATLVQERVSEVMRLVVAALISRRNNRIKLISARSFRVPLPFFEGFPPHPSSTYI